MIHTRFFIIILIILGGIASCQDQPDNLSIKENHANIKSRSLAISKDEAIDLVKQKVLCKDTSDINVFISNTIIEENDTIQRYLSGNSIIKSSCWFFFVDDNPMENWSHPCRYIYVTMNGEFSIEHHSFPPKMENMTQIISSSATPYIQSTPLLSFQQINNPKATANLHNKYALIINGGIDKENNHLRYWNNCSAFYSALTKIYGYSKSNITTLMADGQNPEKDRNLNNGEYDSTPLDLDGDGTPDINSSATRSSVISSFQRYAELLTQEDDLIIFITSHGGQINSETYTFTMRNDVLLFNHRSALVNCDSEGANVQVQTQGNTLIIKEEYLGKQEANCNCMMNLDYAIRNLSHQTYRIKVITPTATLAEFDLKVDEKTEAIITYPRYK